MSSLTENQRILLNAALGQTAPFMTDDPEVNHAVDEALEVGTDDPQKIPYDEALYLEEIEHWKKSGGFLLSYAKDG